MKRLVVAVFRRAGSWRAAVVGLVAIGALSSASTAAAVSPPAVTVETLVSGAWQPLAPGAPLTPGAQYRVRTRSASGTTTSIVTAPQAQATDPTIPPADGVYPWAGPLLFGAGSRAIQADPLWVLLEDYFVVYTRTGPPPTTRRLRLRSSVNGGPWRPFSEMGRDAPLEYYCLGVSGPVLLMAFSYYDVDTGEVGPDTLRLAAMTRDPLALLFPLSGAPIPPPRCPVDTPYPA